MNNTITLRFKKENTLIKLKELAKENGVSLNSIAVSIIENSLDTSAFNSNFDLISKQNLELKNTILELKNSLDELILTDKKDSNIVYQTLVQLFFLNAVEAQRNINSAKNKGIDKDYVPSNFNDIQSKMSIKTSPIIQKLFKVLVDERGNN